MRFSCVRDSGEEIVASDCEGETSHLSPEIDETCATLSWLVLLIPLHHLLLTSINSFFSISVFPSSLLGRGIVEVEYTHPHHHYHRRHCNAAPSGKCHLYSNTLSAAAEAFHVPPLAHGHASDNSGALSA